MKSILKQPAFLLACATLGTWAAWLIREVLTWN